MTELAWDAWRIAPTADTSMSLNIQGTSLHDILCLVRSEIDKLRRGDPKAAIAALSNRCDDDREKHKADIIRLNDKIDRMAKKLSEAGSTEALEEKLKKALDRIQNLEDKMQKTVPPPVEPIVADLESRVRFLEDKLNDLSNQAPSSVPNVPDNLLERIDHLETKEKSLGEKCSNLLDRVRQLEDSTFALSSQQGKIIGDLAKLATSNEATQRNLDNVENMTDRHTEDIKDLFANKADISDLNERFRAVGGVMPSGTVSTSAGAGLSRRDDSKLAEMVHELDKQLKLLSAATAEGLHGVEKKTDKKIEFMTNWIIKYLKNLLANGGAATEGDTDIGKVNLAVRCLVCNKPSKQNESDSVNPYPNFKTSFGVKKERKVRTDNNGTRVDTGFRGSYNNHDDWRVERTDSPPHNRGDSPPTVTRDRPKSAHKPPHVKAIALADTLDNSEPVQIEDSADRLPRSATYNADDSDPRTPFYKDMEKKYITRPISAPYRRPSGN